MIRVGELQMYVHVSFIKMVKNQWPNLNDLVCFFVFEVTGNLATIAISSSNWNLCFDIPVIKSGDPLSNYFEVKIYIFT
jgi:hypothetical protein